MAAEPVEIFTSDSDAWDDSALIKAWDSTITSFKSGLIEGENSSTINNVNSTQAKKNNGSSNNKKKSSKKRSKKNKSTTLTADQWKVGEHCHAKYRDDGMFYPADIIALCGTFATVCYIGYDEICDVLLPDLNKVPPSLTESPTSNCVPPSNDFHTNYNSMFFPQKQCSMMPPPPPPPAPCPIHHHVPYNMYQPSMGHSHGPIPQPPCPPHPFSNSNCTDESLASMLMSWYKTGFSTGYYQALREHNIVPTENCKVPR